MAEQNAWVTLATNDSYCLGALVLAHSLRRVGTKYQIAILITPTVSEIMKARLATVFSQVTLVDVLDSKDAAHLSLLARPELGITFTKLHCWNLTQYKKCVFLDADTLVLQNSDELFEREEFSAAPDVGWPDCFNSGVFVFQPSKETFETLIKFAQEKGSFDGGDQGLLNQYFSDWARGDINKHLPFLYNVCSTAFYSYLPAFKQFGADTKIMHFIGSVKPWMQKFNWASRTVSEEGHLQAPSQTWWNIFLENVHPCLDAGMARWECGASNEARYYTPHDDQSSFPWHHIPPPVIEQPPSAVPHSAEFYDPWETYTPAPADVPASTSSRCSSISDDSVIRINETFETAENVEPPITYPPKPWYETYIPEVVQSNDEEEWHDSLSHMNDSNVPCGPGGSHCGTVSYSFNFEYPTSEASKSSDWQRLDEDPLNEEVSNITSDIMKNDEEPMNKPLFEEVIPRHPYDNYYLLHKTVLDDHGSKRCTHEELPPAPSPSPTPSVDTEPDLQTGIAGALSQLTIGTSEQGSAVEEHLRRQGWETGNIDYMGADSFDNILAKISQTLSSPPEQPASDSSASNVSPTEVPSPVAAPAVFDLPLPEVAPGSKIVICPMQPKPAEVTPTEVAPVAPVVAAPETKTKIESVTQESQATTDEKQDSKQAETNTTDISMSTPCEVPPSKPFEKLVCHLKPTEGVDPLVTPENEHEEAASIAMRIIASEEALSSPIITSATPPISTPTHPAIPQNIKDLAIDTRIPETPPVPGPVSLAQIGILPLEQPSSLSDIAEKCELSTGKDEPLQDSPVAEPIVKEDATKPVETVPVSKDELSETPKTDETTPIVDDIKADPIVKEASIEEPPKSSETDVAPVAEVEAVPKVEEKIETPKPEEPATPVAVPEVVQKEEEKITPLEAEVLAATVAVVEAVKKEEDKIEAPKEAEPVAPVAEVEAAPKEESPKSPEPVATVAEVEATPKEESPKSPEPVATVAEVEATPKEESPKSPESVATVAEVEVVPKEAEKIEAPKAAESITPVAEVQAAPKEESPKSPEPVTAVVEAEIVSKKAEKIEAPTPAEPVVAVVEAAIAPKEAKEVEAPKAAEPATPVAEVQAALKEEQKVEPVAEITVKKVVVKTKAVESPKVETSAVAEPIPEVKAAPKKKVKKEKPELPKTSEPVTPVAEIELTLKKEEKTEPPKAETTTVKEPVIPAAEIKVAPKKDKKEKPELPKVEPAEPAVPAKDIKLELSTKKSDPLESPKAPTDLPADSAAPAVKTVKRVVKKPQPVPESEDSKKIEVSADKEKPSEKPLDKKDDASTKEVPAEAVPKPRKVIKKVVKTVPVAKSDSKDETVLKKKADAPPTPVSEPKDSPISEVVSKEKVSVESVTPKDDTKAAIKEADATVKPKKVFKKPPTLLAKSDVAEDTEAKKAEDMPVPPPRKKEKKVEKK